LAGVRPLDGRLQQAANCPEGLPPGSLCDRL
jgi:hypothetical protein